MIMAHGSHAAQQTAHSNMPYPILLYPDPDGGYVAEIPELKGCLAQGETKSECLKELEQVLAIWLATKREHDIPKPDTDRFLERIRKAVS
jgi:antitoxin HicB